MLIFVIYLESNRCTWQPRGIINELIKGMLATCQFLLASLQATTREQIIRVVSSEAAFPGDSHTAIRSALPGAESKLLAPSFLCRGTLSDACLNSALGQQEPLSQRKFDPGCLFSFCPGFFLLMFISRNCSLQSSTWGPSQRKAGRTGG